MLEAAPPSDACSSLKRRKTKTRIGKPVRPGGEEEGGRSWKDTAQLSEERKGRTEGKPLKPTKSLYFPVQDGHCHSSASLLGKENTRTTEGCSQGRRDTGWLCLPLPPSQFYAAVGGKSSRPVCAHCPEKPGRRSGSSPGESWRPRERNCLPHQLLLLSQHHGHQGHCDTISRVSLWLASPQGA